MIHEFEKILEVPWKFNGREIASRNVDISNFVSIFRERVFEKIKSKKISDRGTVQTNNARRTISK